MVHVELVPVRHRRLGTFVAPDPRHGVASTEWNLESYRMLPRGTKIVRTTALGGAGGIERLAIKSEEDGEPRFLPDVLTILHRGGEVPAVALPELLHLLGPTLGRRRGDFEPVLARSGAWQTVGLLGLFILALLGLAGAALLLAPVQTAVLGAGNDGPVWALSVDGPTWLAAPMRVNTSLATADFTPALATAELPAGYWPPLDKFNPPPLPGGDRNPPGFTLARVAAGAEERLVLCNSYERQLLPRVLLRGEVVSAGDLALPAATVAQIGRGARNLQSALVLCQGVSRRYRRSAVDPVVIFLVAPVLIGLVTLPFTVVALLIWRRQAVRRRQVRDLRARLGLPEPAGLPLSRRPLSQ